MTLIKNVGFEQMGKSRQIEISRKRQREKERARKRGREGETWRRGLVLCISVDDIDKECSL